MADEFDPDKYLQSEKQFDPDAYLNAGQQPTIGEHALDVAKQAPAGLMAGLAGPNWLRRAGQAQLEAENLTSLPAPKAEDYEQAASKALPEPIGMPGRMMRAATESIPMGIATGLPPNPASLALQGISAGAEQGVGEATGSPLLGAVAGIGTSLVPGAYHGLRTLLGKHMDYRGAPILEDLQKSIDERYGAARALGVEMKPTSVSRELEDVKNGIDVHPDNAEKTFGFLNRAQGEHAPTAPKTTAEQLGLVEPPSKATVSFDKLDALRRDLRDVWKNAALKGEGDGSEARAAKQAIRGIDEMLSSGRVEAVKGDVQALAQVARKARDEAAAGFRMEAMNALRQRAENTAKAGTVNAERAFRTELKNFVRPNNKGISPAMREGFNRAEIAELGKASEMGSFPFMLRALGIAGGVLGVGGGLYGTYATENPEWLAFGALGLGARRMNAALMRARADRVQRMVASRSPWAQERGIGPSPVTPPPGRNYMMYPAVIGTNAIRSAAGFKKGGRVTKSLRIKA